MPGLDFTLFHFLPGAPPLDVACFCEGERSVPFSGFLPQLLFLQK